MTSRTASGRCRSRQIATRLFERTPGAAPGDPRGQELGLLAQSLAPVCTLGELDGGSLGAALLHGPHDLVEGLTRLAARGVVLFGTLGGGGLARATQGSRSELRSTGVRSAVRAH